MTEAIDALSDVFAVSFSTSDATMITSWNESFALSISCSVKLFARICAANLSFSSSTAAYMSSVILLSKFRRNLPRTFSGLSFR